MAGQTFQNNPTCHICERNEASLFCKCTGALVLFCMDCFPRHNAKYPHAFHQVMPIAAAFSRNPEEYTRKGEALTRAAAELRANITQIEQCSAEFSDLIQSCINYLTEYRSWWLHRLQTEKDELLVAFETAMQEATNCLSQGMEPTSPLAQAVWKLPPKDLQVFSYNMNVPDLQTLCQKWASYQNSLPTICERMKPIPVLKDVKECQAKYDLVLLGDSSVGKRCFFSKYVKMMYNVNKPTIGIDFAIKIVSLKNGDLIKLHLFNIRRELEQNRAYTKLCIVRAVGILLMYDITQMKTFQSVYPRMEVIHNLLQPDALMMLVGCKKDLPQKNPELREVAFETAQQFAVDHKMLFFEVSAISGEGINQAYESFVEEIYQSNRRV